MGANVVVARAYGGKRDRDVSESVHTAIALSLVSGVLLIVMGLAFSRILLEMMGTPDDVLDKAALYMRIYFAGMPVVMLYNFGSAILRAVGDTRRPLYYLSAAGVVNVALNLFFVICLHMDVAGVALATVISQAISAFLVLRALGKSEGGLKLELKKLKIHKNKMFQIFKIGLPAGMQGAIFSISNVLIQSSVNSFGSVAMAGNAASANIEGFVYNAMNAVYQTNLSFTSQNLGGGKYSRINKVKNICLAVVTAVGLVLGLAAVGAGTHLLGIYSSDSDGDRGGNAVRIWRLRVWRGSASNLFDGSGGNPVWNASYEHNRHHLFHLRMDGYHGGKPQRNRLFGASDDCLSDRSLRSQNSVDLHDFLPAENPDLPVRFLPGELDHHSQRSSDLLFYHHEKNAEKGRHPGRIEGKQRRLRNCGDTLKCRKI